MPKQLPDLACAAVAYILGLLPCPAEPGLTYSYTNNLTSISYVLNTTHTNFYEAEDNCIALGGHLISYTSLEEQIDVEAYFMATGGMLPTYKPHR
jgi:hypothetical protein